MKKYILENKLHKKLEKTSRVSKLFHEYDSSIIYKYIFQYAQSFQQLENISKYSTK